MGFPDVLFHYTSNSALLSILKNKSLWLSAQWHLNDYDEGLVFNRIMAERADKLDLPNAHEVIEDLDRFDCYINCLTQHEDMLSQWRGYADDGKGVAIGLKSAAIIDAIRGSSEALLYPVEYVNSFDGLSQEKNNLVDRLLKSKGIPNDGFLRSLIMERWTVKGKGFVEEAEYRLMLTPKTSGDNVRFDSGAEAICNYRTTTNNLREYYEFIFHPKAQCDFISSVVLGPKNDSNVDTVMRLFRHYGFCNVDVTRSRTSYR